MLLPRHLLPRSLHDPRLQALLTAHSGLKRCAGCRWAAESLIYCLLHLPDCTVPFSHPVRPQWYLPQLQPCAPAPDAALLSCLLLHDSYRRKRWVRGCRHYCFNWLSASCADQAVLSSTIRRQPARGRSQRGASAASALTGSQAQSQQPSLPSAAATRDGLHTLSSGRDARLRNLQAGRHLVMAEVMSFRVCERCIPAMTTNQTGDMIS